MTKTRYVDVCRKYNVPIVDAMKAFSLGNNGFVLRLDLLPTLPQGMWRAFASEIDNVFWAKRKSMLELRALRSRR